MAKRTITPIVDRIYEIAESVGGGESTDGLYLYSVAQYFELHPEAELEDLDEAALVNDIVADANT